MKVLTIKEPWASLIGMHIKTIETRSWRTNYRGELFIHAGSSKIPKTENYLNGVKLLGLSPMHQGTIFCKCNLTDCVKITDAFLHDLVYANSPNLLCGDYTLGRYAWILSDIQYLNPPIPAKGKLGIWTIDF